MVQKSGKELEVLAGGGGHPGGHVLLGVDEQVYQLQEVLGVSAALGHHCEYLVRSSHS